MTRPPLGVRLVAWFLLITGVWGVFDLLLATARGQPHKSLIVGLLSSFLSTGLGWALRRGHRQAYVPTLLYFLFVVGWLVWFFLIKEAGRYSFLIRVESLLIVLAIASLPLVAMLRPAGRRWGIGRPDIPERPDPGRAASN